MTKTNILLLALSLTACQDYTFGFYGKPSTPTTNSPTVTRKPISEELIPFSYGTVQSCTTDDQCSGGLICFKQNISTEYVGVCAKIQ